MVRKAVGRAVQERKGSKGGGARGQIETATYRVQRHNSLQGRVHIIRWCGSNHRKKNCWQSTSEEEHRGSEGEQGGRGGNSNSYNGVHSQNEGGNLLPESLD